MSKCLSRYKQLFSEEIRKLKSTKISQQFNKIPIICEPINSSPYRNIEYFELTASNDTKVSILINFIKQKIKLSADQTIWLFCNNKCIYTHITFNELIKYIDSDGFLYLYYTNQQSLG